MGVIGIFRSMGKNFRVCRYTFYFIWKFRVKKCARLPYYTLLMYTKMQHWSTISEIRGLLMNGMHISIRRNTPMLHKLFKKILTVKENKTELFQLVSGSLIFQCNQGTIVCTKGSDVVANVPMLTEHLQCWLNHDCS